MKWPVAARDHGTFCISCHTAVPYALARPALRTPLGEVGLSPNEQRLLDNVVKRVRLGREAAPFYGGARGDTIKRNESRGTESVLNALILAGYNAANGRLGEDTRTALANMWALQQTTGDLKGRGSGSSSATSRSKRTIPISTEPPWQQLPPAQRTKTTAPRLRIVLSCSEST